MDQGSRRVVPEVLANVQIIVTNDDNGVNVSVSGFPNNLQQAINYLQQAQNVVTMHFFKLALEGKIKSVEKSRIVTPDKRIKVVH